MRFGIIRTPGKDPDFLPYVAEADQVKGAVEEPDLVRIHPSPGLLFSAHGVVDHLDGFLIEGRIIDPVDDLPEF